MELEPEPAKKKKVVSLSVETLELLEAYKFATRESNRSRIIDEILTDFFDNITNNNIIEKMEIFKITSKQAAPGLRIIKDRPRDEAKIELEE